MTRTTLTFIVIGLIIGAGAFVALTSSGTSQELNPVLLPLYSGVLWGPVKTATANGASGAEVVSEPIKNISNIAASSTPFVEYYQTKLATAGWTQDMSREAGGPGSEVSVYTRGNQFVIISFRTTFHTKPADAPESCPCDLVFELFSGTTK